MEVQILLCRRVLDRMPETNDDTIAFIQDWLSRHDTKAVVLPRDWREFIAKWENELRDAPESRGPFLALMRGIITPYRDKYAVSAGIENDGDPVAWASVDEVEGMSVITKRHYATCKYIITDEPLVFRGKGLTLPDSGILTPELFAAEVQAESAQARN